MSYLDLGLIKQPLSSRFDELRQAITSLNKPSKYADEAREVLNNINTDLNKIHQYNNAELENNYKTSLVPMLENVYNRLRYF